jgi:hypothetical protein
MTRSARGALCRSHATSAAAGERVPTPPGTTRMSGSDSSASGVMVKPLEVRTGRPPTAVVCTSYPDPAPVKTSSGPVRSKLCTPRRRRGAPTGFARLHAGRFIQRAATTNSPLFLPPKAPPTIHPHLRTTLWISGLRCVPACQCLPPSTAGRSHRKRHAVGVHSETRRRSWADGWYPHCPQHLLLLLMFSLSRKTLTTRAVDGRTPPLP